MIFLDTSAIYALADRADDQHDGAKRIFKALLDAQEPILTHNYVLVESLALIQNRLGFASALRFLEDAQRFETHWVDESTHREGARRLRRSRKPRVSFVDHVSFVVMRARRITTAFAFDQHFEDEGFDLYRL